jgi:hypothetical protein
MEWISVKDKLPEIGQLCVITDGGTYLCGDYRECKREEDESWRYIVDDRWDTFICLCCDGNITVTHWMPLLLLSKE